MWIDEIRSESGVVIQNRRVVSRKEEPSPSEWLLDMETNRPSIEMTGSLPVHYSLVHDIHL